MGCDCSYALSRAPPPRQLHQTIGWKYQTMVMTMTRVVMMVLATMMMTTLLSFHWVHSGRGQRGVHTPQNQDARNHFRPELPSVGHQIWLGGDPQPVGRVGGSSSSVEPIPEERISTHSSFSKEGGEPLLFITSWSLPAETVGNELKASTKYSPRWDLASDGIF